MENKNAVIKQRRHAELTKASSTHVVLKDKLQAWKIPYQVRNDTNFNNDMGFTLIELLVVVLIIGILAAVALPQYTLAVDKSRMSNLVTIARAVSNAQEEYYLANGKYTNKWDELSLDFQGTVVSSTLTMDNGVTLRLSLQTISGPDSVVVSDSRLPGVSLNAGYASTTYGSGSWAKQWRCYASSNNTRANKLCQLVTHRKTHTTGGEDYVYYFPGAPY